LVINTGGRDVVLDKITVRGQECAWTDVYYSITGSPPTADLVFNPYTNLTSYKNVTIGATTYSLTQGESSKDLTLRSGYSIIIYIANPDSISVNDIGLTVAITIHTAQAMYYKECNVDGTT